MEAPFEALTETFLTYLRQGSFYTNLYKAIDQIKRQGVLMGVCVGDDRIVFVSPLDVEDAAAEELLIYPSDRTIRYVGSEEMTCNEAAGIIGNAIGVPGLKWLLLSEDQMLEGMKAAHVPQSAAKPPVAMQAAFIPANHLKTSTRTSRKWARLNLRISRENLP